MCCYAYSRPITINPTTIGASGVANVPNQDQSDYPVMFSGTYSFLATVANGGHVQQNGGQDIVFAADPQGLTILPFERAAYNPVTGEVEFYILISNLSHTTNTVFYILYGSNCADQQNKAGVWIDNYQAVYHFGDGITLDLTDSTGNNNNGTGVGSPSAGATLTGGAGGSLLLSAIDGQYVDCGSSTSIDNISSGNGVSGFDTGFVFQFILNANSAPSSVTQAPCFIGKHGNTAVGWGVQQAPLGAQDPGNVTEVGKPLDGDSFGENNLASMGLAVGNNVYYWVVTQTLNSTTLATAYRNGTTIAAQVKGNSSNAVDPSPGVHMYIGNVVQSVYPSVVNSFYDGRIDEVRIRKAPFVGNLTSGSNSVINRINTEINNIIFTSTFYTVGSETATTAITVSPSGALAAGTIGTPYPVTTFTATGGVGPYSFVVDSGALPTGLTLTSGGVLSGTPTTAGNYNFVIRAVDSSIGCGTASLNIAVSFVPPPPPVIQSGTLRFEIPKARWFAHTYADPMVVHYLDELYPGSVNNLQLLMLSQALGYIYRSGGDTDNGTALTSTVTTPAMDGGDPRIQKLYVDVMNDVDNVGSVTLFAQFNNQSIDGGNVTFAVGGPRIQVLQNISSLSALNLYRNISITYQWTGGPDGPRLYICEPAGYAQPYISTFFVTQFINLAFPGWKHHRRLYAGYISNTTINFTIKTQDGRTFGPYTLPSTGGQFKIVQLMLDQNIKDLAFAYQIDGGGNNFALFPEAWTIEVKEWTEPSYIPLAIFKT